MITTGCEGCYCFKQDNKGGGCALGQMCTNQNGITFAPGYCRLCRSHKWASRQRTTNKSELYRRIIDECTLIFDILLFFDEAIHTTKDLERTLNSNWYINYAQKIIIVDVTGFGNRKNLALQYLKSREHPIHTVVDSSVINESVHQREETIRRLSKQVIAPFFMSIPAGKVPNNFDTFATMVQHVPSRVIHWSFPVTIDKTAIILNKLHYGLFITIPYRALMKSPEVESFTSQLRKEELETEMGLSWFSNNCWLI